MQIVDQSTFNELLSQEKPVLVDFFAEWCGPCRMLAPVLEKLSSQYEENTKIVKVDIDEESELAHQFKVQSIPTLILFKNGQEAERVVGFQSEEDLKNLIERHS